MDSKKKINLKIAPAAPATVSAPAQVPISEESVQMLTAMGFPDAEARAALSAARGNGDLAVEYLMNGIPDHALLSMSSPSATPIAAPAGAPTSGSGDLEQLRHHPQFNQLKRLVQANPAALGQVLAAIGQQDPALLAVIHSNHDAFVAMMNEPIVEAPPAAAAPAAAFGAPPGGLPGMPGMGVPNFAHGSSK